MNTPGRDELRQAIAVAAVLLLGLALQLVMCSRQWMYGDQYALLTPALDHIETGTLAPFTKGMSGGGRIPGSLLQLLVALPLRMWADFRAPALLMGLTQLLAIGILLRVVTNTSGRRVAVAFAAVYWLSPWRLYHSGVLWEPGFVLLPAALHLFCCHALRRMPEKPLAPEDSRRRLLASLVLAATLTATMQIHASFVVLVVATAMLWFRRAIRVDPIGGSVGAVIGGLTLLPTVLTLGSGEVLRAAPAYDERVALPIMVVSNAAKAFVYWLRLGSADIGRRLLQTAWLSDPPAGTEAAFEMPSMLVVGFAALALASVALAAVASWQYIVAKRRPDDGQWLRDYTQTMLVAVVLAAALAPVPIQGWHILIALHAACIPVAFLITAAARHGGWRRTVAVSFIVLLVVVSALLAAGHPTYLWPDQEHALQQNIPDYLRPLIPSMR